MSLTANEYVFGQMTNKTLKIIITQRPISNSMQINYKRFEANL